MAEKSIDQYYKTLGVNPGASRREIDSAYKYKNKIWRVDCQIRSIRTVNPVLSERFLF